jgi:acetylornithine deacetylase
MPGGDIDALVERIRHAATSTVDPAALVVEVISNSPPMLLDEATTVYKELSAITGQSGTHSVNFATDAGWFQTRDFDCVLFGPGSIEVAHRPNEFMPKDEFEKGAVLLDQIIQRFCMDATP